MSGSGISWAICKLAPCSRHTTTPAPYHSIFYRPDALPAAQPTASKHNKYINKYGELVHSWATVGQVLESQTEASPRGKRTESRCRTHGLSSQPLHNQVPAALLLSRRHLLQAWVVRRMSVVVYCSCNADMFFGSFLVKQTVSMLHIC